MKRIILSLIILSSTFSLLAQTVEIRGTVFDESGKPIRYGCSVYTSKNSGTLTDSVGRYSLLVPSNKETTIYFSYLGYKDEFIVVNPDAGQTDYPIKMEIDTTAVFGREVLVCMSNAQERNDSLWVWTQAFPVNAEYMVLYTQERRSRSSSERQRFGAENYPIAYVFRFEDANHYPISHKLKRSTLKVIKKYPIDRITFAGFVLDHIDNMQNDTIAQIASAKVASYGLHDYGKRDTPVYYYRRK